MTRVRDLKDGDSFVWCGRVVRLVSRRTVKHNPANPLLMLTVSVPGFEGERGLHYKANEEVNRVTEPLADHALAVVSVASYELARGRFDDRELTDALARCFNALECVESIVRDLAANAQPSDPIDGICPLCQRDLRSDGVHPVFANHSEDCVWRRAVEVENTKKAQ